MSKALDPKDTCVLVTGGAGFIGSHTVVQLLEGGYQVVIVDDLSNSSAVAVDRVKTIVGEEAAKNLTFYEANVLDREAMNKIFDTHQIDRVIHFAGFKAVGESVSKPVEYYHNNIENTLVLVDVMRNHGCKSIIFSSSSTVYGDPDNPPVTEEDPKKPATNPYGWTKWMIEQILMDVHTADPGKILSEAIKYGYLTNFKIENMHEQFLARQKQGKSLEKQASAEKAPSQASEFIYAAVDPSRDYGFVAVAAGEGLKAVFTDLAADAVVSGGQTMNPSTEDILAAIQSVPAKTVFVLPNNKNIIMAAEQAQKLADRQVVVLPTRTVPMGITALLNFDPSVNAETNTINMMAAADKVSTGLITYAARDSEYDGKRIRKGEIMALENGKIVSTSTDITKATYRLARNMCKKDSSFVTIISGCDVSDEDAEKVTEIVKAKCPNHVEVSHIRGGQPVYYYMISVE